MKYSFWNDYKFLTYDILLKFDIRLNNVISKLESFFSSVKISDYKKEKLEFILAGSCIKSDTFRDLDLFFPTNEDLNEVLSNISKDYFIYENNSNTYNYEDDIIQLVYRERFVGKDLDSIVDIFDFYSTKIAFKCIYDNTTCKIEVIKTCIKEEFIEYLKTKKNGLTRVNSNPFVSLQRAIHFLKRGDDVPFSVFLDIFLKINELDKTKSIEEHFEKLQGDDKKIDEIKDSIKNFLISLNSK